MREIITAFSSYEGALVNFCNSNNISKNQLYYYKKEFEKEDNIKFHAISMKEEKVHTEVTVIPDCISDIRIEIGCDNIYVTSNEIATLSKLAKDMMAHD